MTNKTARVIREAPLIREAPPGVTKQYAPLDDGPTHCQLCEKTLSEKNRKEQRGWCDDCRSPSGKMQEIWIALMCFQQGQPIPSNIKRLREWSIIKNLAKKRFHHPTFTEETWNCLVDWLQDERDIEFEQFLWMTPEAVANLLSVVETPPVPNEKSPAGKSGNRRRRRGRATQPTPELTPKQAKALTLLGECNNISTAAAKRMGVSRTTFREHTEAAYRKLGVKAISHRTTQAGTDHRGQSTVHDESDRRRL